MMFNIRFKKRYAISVREDSLRKIPALIDDYYPEVRLAISVSLINGAIVTFANIDELLSFGNSGKFRIKELSITSQLREIAIMFEPKIFFDIPLFMTTVSVNFSLEKKDECITLQAKLEDLLHEMKLPFSYNMFCKCTPNMLIIAASLITILYLNLQPSVVITQPVSVQSFIIIILYMFLYFAILFGLDKAWNYLFLPIQFNWGYEEKRLEQLSKTRTMVLWGVLGTVILGVISSIIANLIS